MANGLEATNNLTSFLTERGKPTDPNSLRSIYNTKGLTERLGVYAGTGQQHRAVLNLLRGESNTNQFGIISPETGSLIQPPGVQPGQLGYISPETGSFIPAPSILTSKNLPTNVKPQDVSAAVTFATEADKVAKMKGQLETAKKTLLSMQTQVTKLLERDAKKIETVTSEGTQVRGDATGNGTTPLGGTDIVKLIGDISSGELVIPEMEIEKQRTALATEAEKSRAAAALSQTQQLLARQGMTFSSIRAGAEEKLAAESMARLSGISLDMASSIIRAARQEQSRIAPTYREFGGVLYEMKPGEAPKKILEAPPEVESMTYQGKKFVKNATTGQWNLEFAVPEIETMTYEGQRWSKDPDTGQWTLDISIPRREEKDKPIVEIGGQKLDLSDISGIEQYKKLGGIRASARAVIDATTDYTETTISEMLDAVYGKKLETFNDIRNEAAITIMGIEGTPEDPLPSRKQMRDFIKEQWGLDTEADKKYWDSILSRFPEKLGWWR